ncbi:MAG: flagellar brake domain-containing protein [Deltaproteobacteria bacterium]|nr:flagellar brake domain-containing protein [Deltaproteobacteria bacterium]
MPDKKPENQNALQTAAPQAAAEPLPVVPPFRLPIPVGAEILIEFVNLNLRIKSALVGLDHGQFILAKIFQNDLIGTFRSEAIKVSPVIVRYLYKGTVYGFNTETLNVVTAPEKLLFFAYPKKIDETHPLASDRHECRLPAVTMLGNDIVEMTVVDISKEGCLCVIKTAGAKGDALYKLIQVNKPLEVKMQLPGERGNSPEGGKTPNGGNAPLPEKLGVMGRVRNMSKGNDRIIIGVMFDGAGADVKAKISAFIALLPNAVKK